MLVIQHRVRVALASCLIALSASQVAAQEQQSPCGDDVKAYIVEALSKYDDLEAPDALAVQEGLYEKFKYCAAETPVLKTPLSSALLLRPSPFCGKLSAAGSLFYEQMRCCGYHPQQRMFGCPIDVKQPFGFGSAPFPGSREHVLSCVDFGAGFVPVALDNVHLADAVSGAPPWQFAVIAKARGQLAEMPLTGRTFVARSILSWQLVPTSCNYTPIWGNAIDYQIRLDP
jgi:hypothetical protein